VESEQLGERGCDRVRVGLGSREGEWVDAEASKEGGDIERWWHGALLLTGKRRVVGLVGAQICARDDVDMAIVDGLFCGRRRAGGLFVIVLCGRFPRVLFV
jgi:hypothetical protein